MGGFLSTFGFSAPSGGISRKRADPSNFLQPVVSRETLWMVRLPKVCMASKQRDISTGQNHNGLLSGKH